jgi:hypothetical protein
MLAAVVSKPFFAALFETFTREAGPAWFSLAGARAHDGNLRQNAG